MLDKDVRPILVTLVKGFSKRALQEKRKHVPEALSKLVDMIVRRKELDEDFSYENEKTALKHCVERLSHRNREIIRLHYFSEFSLREIGEVMFLSPNAVSHALCRIRELLRKCIRKNINHEGGSK